MILRIYEEDKQNYVHIVEQVLEQHKKERLITIIFGDVLFKLARARRGGLSFTYGFVR